MLRAVCCCCRRSAVRETHSVFGFLEKQMPSLDFALKRPNTGNGSVKARCESPNVLKNSLIYQHRRDVSGSGLSFKSNIVTLCV